MLENFKSISHYFHATIIFSLSRFLAEGKREKVQTVTYCISSLTTKTKANDLPRDSWVAQLFVHRLSEGLQDILEHGSKVKTE